MMKRLQTLPIVAALLALILLAGCVTGGGDVAVEGAPALGDSLPADRIIRSASPVITIDPGIHDPRDVAEIRVEVYDTADERVTEYRLPFAQTVTLPLSGLEDGESYRFRFFLVMKNGDEHRFGEDYTLTLNLAIPVPVVAHQAVVTFNPAPELTWQLPGAGELSGYIIRADEGRYDVTSKTVAAFHSSERFWVNSGEIDAGRTVTWQVRLVTPEGVLGRWSAAGTVRFTDEVPPPQAKALADGGPSIVSRPAISWDGLSGAVTHRLELTVTETVIAEARDEATVVSLVPLKTITLAENRHSLDSEQIAELLDALPPETDGVIAWRVSAGNEIGNWTAPSRWYRFRYHPMIAGVETVLPPGASAVMTLGSNTPLEPDEGPPLTVLLDRPFAMARYELTAEAAAALFSSAIAAGRAELTTDGQGRSQVVDAVTGYRLLGLDSLDFGVQYTLRMEGTTVVPREGYRSHPAVGVSWYGAVFLAQELSLLEGRQPVYQTGSYAEAEGAGTEGAVAEDAAAEDTLSIVPDLGGDGYRLPSEAEWALAAALTRPIQPDGQVQAAEGTPLTPLERRGANYQRSGDRWEDLLPPYTAAGGPTNPVGAMGYGGALGIYDLMGNVWEWTEDWYDPQWYAAAAAAAAAAGQTLSGATAPPSGPPAAVPDFYGRILRTVRGGAWNTPVDALRRSNRGAFGPEATSHSIGVRFVRTLSRTPAPDARNN